MFLQISFLSYKVKKTSSFDVLKGNKNITIIILLFTNVFCENVSVRMFWSLFTKKINNFHQKTSHQNGKHDINPIQEFVLGLNDFLIHLKQSPLRNMSPKLLPYDIIKDIILWHHAMTSRWHHHKWPPSFYNQENSWLHFYNSLQLAKACQKFLKSICMQRTFWRMFCKCKISCFLSKQLKEAHST